MTLPEGYIVNGVVGNWLLYMLGNGIYPDWSIILTPLSAPSNNREKHYTEKQDSIRKDIERVFRVLQGSFKILRYEMHEWSYSMLILISQVCVILHNIIVDMDLRGELNYEADGNKELTNLITEFLEDGIQDGVNTDVDETIGQNASFETSVVSFLLERSNFVYNNMMHRKLAEAFHVIFGLFNVEQ